MSPGAVGKCEGDIERPAPEFEVQRRPPTKEAVMAIYYTDCDDIVDPLDDDFDAENLSTKRLEAEQKRLKVDAETLDALIDDLVDRLIELQRRVAEVDDELGARAEREFFAGLRGEKAEEAEEASAAN
jgi:hypothetical protein